MNWTNLTDQYRGYITLERRLSRNSVSAYMRDIELFRGFVEERFGDLQPSAVAMDHIEAFMAWLYDRGTGKSSQARILSGVRSFYNFLLVTDKIENVPTDLVEAPKTSRHLPDTLSYGEIVKVLDAIDLSSPHGHRNRAILEVLYGCGLRVSELTELKISDLYLNDGFIRVTGKGDKQRLVPIGENAVSQINIYMGQRRTMAVDARHADYVFLNYQGKHLSRISVFTIIKDAVAASGIDKRVSPHTFRHSFATHLLLGGADIRMVQELLGHESILTTEIYTHLGTRQLHDAVEHHHPLSDSGNGHEEGQ